MKKEIERKFLVKAENLPQKLSGFRREEIMQGYVPRTDDLEERLRKAGDKFYHTLKTKDKKNRGETEKQISSQEFDELWQLVNSYLEKMRFYIPYAGREIHLDVYSGNLAGRITAEIEFENEESAYSFIFPSWFGEEITEDDRYKNRNLAVNGFP